MDVDAADRHHGQIGGESFAVDFALSAAIERVTGDGAEFLQIDVIDTVADLLIAGEADADRSMRQFRPSHQLRRRLHNDGHARLVVGAQQRRAVGSDKRLTFEMQQLRIVANTDDLAGIAG